MIDTAAVSYCCIIAYCCIIYIMICHIIYIIILYASRVMHRGRWKKPQVQSIQWQTEIVSRE